MSEGMHHPRGEVTGLPRTGSTRALVVAALLGLGAMAAWLQHPDERLAAAAPELSVHVVAPAAADADDLARCCLEPLEERIDALGSVEVSRGEITSHEATLHLRLRAGADVTAELARAQVELGAVAAQLPAGAKATVVAGGQEEDLFAVVWLAGPIAGARHERPSPEAIEAAANTLRRVRGVQGVSLIGCASREVAVEISPRAPRDEAFAMAVEQRVAAAAAPAPLGRLIAGGRRAGVDGASARDSSGIASLSIPFGGAELPLGALARVSLRRAQLSSAARREGRPMVAMLISRDRDSRGVAVAAALRRAVVELDPALGAEIGWCAADSLRALVGILLLGMGLAGVCGAVYGRRRGGAGAAVALAMAPAVMTAAAAVLWWLAARSLHQDELLAAWIGTAVALPLAARRVLRLPGQLSTGIGKELAVAIAAAALLPASLALAPAAIAVAWAPAAQAFWLAFLAAAVTVPLLPACPSRRGRVPRLLPSALRDPGSVLLVAGAVGLALAAVFGGSLPPRSRAPLGAADLAMEVRQPPGTPLRERLQRLDEAESELRHLEGVGSTWSTVDDHAATVRVRLASGVIGAPRRARLLRVASARLGDRATLRSLDTNGQGVADDIEDDAVGGLPLLVPMADVDGFAYRALLRGRDLAALNAARERLRSRLASQRNVRDSWWEPQLHGGRRLRLVPRSGADPELVAMLSRALQRHASTPRSFGLAGETDQSVTVHWPGMPSDDAHPPQARELLRKPIWLADGAAVPQAFFEAHEEQEDMHADRQDGSWVVPLVLHPPFAAKQMRSRARQSWQGELQRVGLPAGVALAVPSLDPLRLRWPPALRRRLTLAAALPLLLLAVATLLLGRLGAAVELLLVLLLAGILAAPAAAIGHGFTDGLAALAVLALAAAALGWLAPWLRQPLARRPAASYRAARGAAPAMIAASWMMGAALLVPGFLSLLPGIAEGGDRALWGLPLRVAGMVAITAAPLALRMVPALQQSLRGWRHARSAMALLEREPPSWAKAGALRLGTRSLTKVYPTTQRGQNRPTRALDRITLTLEPGIIGLLGPNGSGKTTLLRLLTGLLQPSRGQIVLSGVPIAPANLAAYRSHIGYLPQGFDAYPGLTAAQFLEHWARERGLRDRSLRQREIERLLGVVGLSEHADRKVRDFSGGMRQRVGIARALLGAPPVVVVDEPTTGLDLESRERFREALLAIAGERIIIFSTHVASDVEALVSRLLVLEAGRMRFDGPTSQLVAGARGRVFEALVTDAELPDFAHRFQVTSRVREIAGLRLRALASPGEPLPGDAVEPTLEEAYLALMRAGR